MVALCLVLSASDRAAAGRIGVVEDTLYFDELDALGQPHNVTVTESGGLIIIYSAGDVIVGVGGPCQYVSPPAQDTVRCDTTNIRVLAIVTGAADDRISVGSSLPTVLCGGPGNDVISGGTGRDIIAGAAGDDVMSGGGGDDFLRADTVAGQEGPTASLCTADPGSAGGSNTLEGGPGSDLLVGDDGRDVLRGGPGADVEFGRPGDDTMDGGEGEDLLVGLDGQDTLDGGPDTDVLSGGDGSDRLQGGGGADDLALPVLLVVDHGGPVEASLEYGDDLMDGGDGDDRLFAGPGDRTVSYGLDTDQRAGGRAEANGADTLVGGAGVDQVSYVNREISVSISLNGQPDDGAPGEGDNVASDVERLTGGTKDDAVSGGPGNDTMEGGPGSDRLSGLDGADTLDGGAADEGAEVLSGGPGADALRGGPGPDELSGGDGNDGLQGGGGPDRLDGDAGDDDLHGDADADTLAGSAGADVLDGGAGSDLADYAAAPKAVTVSLDSVRNDGERGEDWVRDVERIRGSPGPDTLVGKATVNAIDGGAGDDLIDAGGGPDSVNAGPGRDVVLARDDVRDAVACGAGADLAIVDEQDDVRSGRERCERADTGGRARRDEALLRPGACQLDLRLPGMSRAVPLRQALSIPRRTSVDAGHCMANLSTVRRGPRGRAGAGIFTLRRAGNRRRPIELGLSGADFSSTCRKQPASRRVRRLLVAVRGRAKLVARYGSAVGRNAAWTIEDRCGSTVTRVRSGSVSVTDRGARRPVVVHAGHSHVSRPRPAKAH
jgi:Ca2+-binding RTX toxin-like protein